MDLLNGSLTFPLEMGEGGQISKSKYAMGGRSKRMMKGGGQIFVIFVRTC